MRGIMIGLLVLVLMNNGVGAAIAEQWGGARAVWAASTSRSTAPIASGRVVGMVLDAAAERLGLR